MSIGRERLNEILSRCWLKPFHGNGFPFEVIRMSKTETHRNELQKEMRNLQCKRNCGGCGWQRQPNHTYNKRMDVVFGKSSKEFISFRLFYAMAYTVFTHSSRPQKPSNEITNLDELTFIT